MPNADRTDTQSHSFAGSPRTGSTAAPSPEQCLVRFADAAPGHGRRRRLGRVWRAAGRFAATFAAGVAVFLAWPLGDAAREMIANAAPQLWVARQVDDFGAAAVVPAAAAIPAPLRPGVPPPDLAAVRSRIDRLAASAEEMTRTVAALTDGQTRLAQEIARIEEVEARLLHTTPGEAAPARIPLPEPRPGRRAGMR